MKKYCAAVLISLSALQVAALVTLKKDPAYRDARRNGAQTKIELHIADDDGTPVPDAKIKAYLGMNFRPLGTWIDGTTDTNGVFVLEGKTCGDEIEVFVAKDGYYGSHVIYRYAKMGEERDVKDGKWQPYGAAEKIPLREIVNPCHLANIEKWVDVPCTNTWIGFDMELGDFVAPLGMGKVPDFEVFVEWDGRSADSCSMCKAEIRFSAKGSGGYFSDKIAESAYKFSYRADTNALLLASFATINRDGDFFETHAPFPEDRYFVTKTRCVVKEKEETVVAHYGYIRRLDVYPSKSSHARIDYSGVFNSVPNDLNLEPKGLESKSLNYPIYTPSGSK